MITDLSLKRVPTAEERCGDGECHGEIAYYFPVIIKGEDNSFHTFFPCRTCGVLQGMEMEGVRWDWSEEKLVRLPRSRDVLLTIRKVIVGGQIDTKKMCPPYYDYCWECGFVAPAEEFRKKDRCPNPNCPNPSNWND